MKRALLTAAIIMMGAQAHAAIIPSLYTATAVGGGDTTFDYSANLAADQGLTSGSQFAILNFAGYVANSVATTAANFTASTTTSLPSDLSGPVGFTQTPGTVDLVFTYNGPDYRTSGGVYSIPTSFATFTAESTFSGLSNGFYSAVAVKNYGLDAGTLAYNQGQVFVPGPVPEPAAWALMLTGVAFAGSAIRRQRAKVVVA